MLAVHQLQLVTEFVPSRDNVTDALSRGDITRLPAWLSARIAKSPYHAASAFVGQADICVMPAIASRVVPNEDNSGLFHVERVTGLQPVPSSLRPNCASAERIYLWQGVHPSPSPVIDHPFATPIGGDGNAGLSEGPYQLRLGPP